MNYVEVVSYLESLSIMPKTMPGLDKVKKALAETDWYQKIDPEKVIIVAGTNGKGTTCACLERLLISAKQQVGFYSSPHLVETTERIRTNGVKISKEVFVNTFDKLKSLIDKYELTHFEALTLMTGDIFFAQNKLDYAIFEVGLGGTFDATNAYPHVTSVITSLSLDHTNILGNSLLDVAKNKFGIVQNHNQVIHTIFPSELIPLKKLTEEKTQSNWFAALPYSMEVEKTDQEPNYILKSNWGSAYLSLLGNRAVENANLALTIFFKLGFDPKKHMASLAHVYWPGRMQKITWPNALCPIYLSGDHNPAGMQSLIEILNNFRYNQLHLIVGIGVDKDAEEMLGVLLKLDHIKLYLTETPFKGRKLSSYSERFLQAAKDQDVDAIALLNRVSIAAKPDDLIIVTGSLYLVGKVLQEQDFS